MTEDDRTKAIIDFATAFRAVRHEITNRVDEAFERTIVMLKQESGGQFNEATKFTIVACAVVQYSLESQMLGFAANLSAHTELYERFGADARRAMFHLLDRYNIDPIARAISAGNYRSRARRDEEYNNLLQRELSGQIINPGTEEVKLYNECRQDVFKLARATLRRMQVIRRRPPSP
jgi:hypothetical protein